MKEAAATAASSAKGPAPAGRSAGFGVGVAAAAIAAALVHASSLGVPFFADDWLFLDQARSRSLFGVLGSPDPLGNFFRPLGRQVWFWLWANVGHENPVVFHAANVALFVAAVVLLALLVRRVSGPFAGVVAAGFLALHYAADVPVRWASGSQELLALTASLGALLAYVSGRRVWGGVLFACALLAKESVVLLPVAAAALDTEGGGLGARIRRLLPLLVALVAWVALAAWATLQRGAPGAGLTPSALGPLAVPLLFVRVVAGLEWPTGGFPFLRPVDPGGTFWVAVLVVIASAWGAAPAVARATSTAARGARTSRRDKRAPAPPAPPATEPERGRPALIGIRAGLLWALVGALPVAVVAPIWSAYYFLFAVAGVGLALGTWVARMPNPGLAACVTLAILGWTSSQARELKEFSTAPSMWSAQSHVNRFYMDRGMKVVARAVRDLREQVPKPEKGTTFFFAGIPAFASVQVADGPLVRGVYRDSSLRGYFLSEMTRERLARGPWRVFFYEAKTGFLRDNTKMPGVFLSSALGAILNDRPATADGALQAAREHGEGPMGVDYLAAFVALELGDTARTHELIVRSGARPGRNGSAALQRARELLAQGDSGAAANVLRKGIETDALDPRLHGLFSDVLLGRPAGRAEGQVEAYAARLLAPESPAVWRRWGIVLTNEFRIREAIAAFERYAKMDPEGAAADERVTRMRQTLPRMLPGGDIAQRAMQRELNR